MIYYVIPLSVVSYQKNVQSFACLVKLLAKSPTDFDGLRCFDTSCMVGFCSGFVCLLDPSLERERDGIDLLFEGLAFWSTNLTPL